MCIAALVNAILRQIVFSSLLYCISGCWIYVYMFIVYMFIIDVYMLYVYSLYVYQSIRYIINVMKK